MSLDKAQDGAAYLPARMGSVQPVVWIVAAVGLLIITGFATDIGGWRIGAGGLLGGLGGFALYHASFGFTSGWRHFIRTRRGAGQYMKKTKSQAKYF